MSAEIVGEGGATGGWEDDPKFADSIRRVTLGQSLDALAADHAAWSRATFGEDHERGPVGPLRHLAKEAEEAVEAWEAVVNAQGDHDPHAAMMAEKFNEELGDCLLLLLDASRRGGLSPLDVVKAAQEKMPILRQRVYQRTPDGVPSEHRRGGWRESLNAVGQWFSRWNGPLYFAGAVMYFAGVLIWVFTR